MHMYMYFMFTDVDECVEGLPLCHNGGTCVDLPPTQGFFECICPAEWAGPHCNNGKLSITVKPA